MKKRKLERSLLSITGQVPDYSRGPGVAQTSWGHIHTEVLVEKLPRLDDDAPGVSMMIQGFPGDRT